MANKPQSSRIRAVPLAIQDLQIRSQFEGFKSSRGKDLTEMVWVGQLQPTGESPAYKVKVHYRLGKTPRVWVLSPALKPNPPHIYKIDGSLCLFTPSEGSWREDKLIAETILPWTAIWLYFYELWVDTDKWQGPETLHGPISLKEEEKGKGKR